MRPFLLLARLAPIALAPIALVPIALVLAGCGALDQDPVFTNAECRTVMYANPAVKEAMAIVAISGNIARGEERPALEVAKQRAYNGCLRDKGLMRGGGVQPVKK